MHTLITFRYPEDSLYHRPEVVTTDGTEPIRGFDTTRRDYIVTSGIVDYDPETKVATTRSGSKYRIVILNDYNDFQSLKGSTGEM